VHLLGGEQGIQHHLSGSSGFERVETADPAFERERESEQKPSVQGSRVCRNHRSRFRECAETTGPGFERELTLPQCSRGCRTRG
jgi:hypothetical protein